MFNSKLIGKTLVFVTIALSSAGSFAAKENHSASNCILERGGAIDYGFYGAVYNSSTTLTSRILCPIPHTDFDGFLNAGEIDGGWVDTVDKNASKNISCRFRSQSINNNGTMWIASSALKSTHGFGTHKQRLSLSKASENANSAYNLACNIPPKTSSGSSKVVIYQVRQ